MPENSPAGSEARESTAPALLQMSGIVKTFPGVRALNGVDLELRAGEVHCLLGQNGAGKSTLIKVLAGAHRPDAGQIMIDGHPVHFGGPQDALDAGIATIYQELDLIDGLTVAENIYLGNEQARLGVTRPRRINAAAEDLLRRLGHPEISPSTEVGHYPAAARQIVSMARALSREARLIIMDEPTAVLDSEEVDGLFEIVARLREQGTAVVYISHRLEEIRRIGDRITVLKDGATVGVDLPVADTSTPDLITLMTGRKVEYVFPPRNRPTAPEPLLEVEGLGVEGEFSDIGFTVGAGEIFGLAGLVGSGRSEILETIFGARRPQQGSVRVGGRPLRGGSVDQAVRAGVGLCPEERKTQGLVLDATIVDNITLSTFGRFATAGVTRAGAERAAAQANARRVHLQPPDVSRITRTLSGGNQQKVVLARWLLTDCRVLLLDEPTRGVDVGARSEIYRLINELADAGVAVVVVSSELNEVLGLADRVTVIADGRAVHTAVSDELDEHRILDLVMEGKNAMEGLSS